jgi:hypothetical protein
MALLSLDGIIASTLGLDEFGIEKLRSVEWAKKHLWALKFIEGNDNPPAPFDQFFPAIDVEVGEASLDSFSFDLGDNSFKIPQKSTVREMRITFIDDENLTIFNWIKNWIRIDLLNNGKYISAINDDHPRVSGQGNVKPVRQVQVTKLKSSRFPSIFPPSNFNSRQIVNTYAVYPEGVLEFSGSSESGAQIYTVSFVIVEERVPFEASDSASESIKGIAQKFISRFI